MFFDPERLQGGYPFASIGKCAPRSIGRKTRTAPRFIDGLMCECIGRNTTTAPWFIDGLMRRKSERHGAVLLLLLLLLLLSSFEATVVVRSRSSSRSDRMRQKRVLAGRFQQRRHCSRVQKQIHHRCDGERGRGGRRRGELVYKQSKGKGEGEGNRPASSTGEGYLTLSLAATAGHTLRSYWSTPRDIRSHWSTPRDVRSHWSAREVRISRFPIFWGASQVTGN